jgi:hypothetical protein
MARFSYEASACEIGDEDNVGPVGEIAAHGAAIVNDLASTVD